MSLHKFVFVCLLLVFPAATFSQSIADATVVPLVVEKGFPLQVLLTQKLSFKNNESVYATLIEPVYSFDREVIPAGTEVEGRITGFQKAGKWKRISALLGGDFTSVREPEIEFHALILANGTRIPIQTYVAPGIEKSVESDDKHGHDLENSLTSTSKKSGKERLKSLLWGVSPYRPQYLTSGTRLSAVLMQPLDFGEALVEPGALDELGSQPPANSIVSVRLITPLDSRTARPGTPVQALLTRPLFDSSRRLIFPVGAVMSGTVTEVKPARSRHRHGQLAFNLTTIAPPGLLAAVSANAQSVEGSLLSVHVPHYMKDLRINESGLAHIVESKKRFIGPAWAFIKAERAIGHTADPFEKALLGAYRGKFLKQVTGTGSGSGFGLPASIGGAMVPPVGIGLGFYGAARSVYSNFLGRGRDISLPVNMPMEIRLGKTLPAPYLEERPQLPEESAR